jgi:hypothetical protein
VFLNRFNDISLINEMALFLRPFCPSGPFLIFRSCDLVFVGFKKIGMKTEYKMECNMKFKMEWKRKSRWKSRWNSRWNENGNQDG